MCDFNIMKRLNNKNITIYKTTPAFNTFFFTHSFSMYLIDIPQTHYWFQQTPCLIQNDLCQTILNTASTTSSWMYLPRHHIVRKSLREYTYETKKTFLGPKTWQLQVSITFACKLQQDKGKTEVTVIRK